MGRKRDDRFPGWGRQDPGPGYLERWRDTVENVNFWVTTAPVIGVFLGGFLTNFLDSRNTRRLIVETNGLAKSMAKLLEKYVDRADADHDEIKKLMVRMDERMRG